MFSSYCECIAYTCLNLDEILSRPEEARKEPELYKDILEGLVFSYTVLFTSHFQILNFFSSEPIT